MSEEILTAIERSNAAFAEFKAAQEKRFERMEAKMFNRPGNGSVAGGDHDAKLITADRGSLFPDVDFNDPEIKSFDRYLRTGIQTKDMSVGSAQDGGYAVPKAIDAMIEAVLLKQSPIRQYAQVIQVTTPDFHKLVNKRGFQASWVGETAARPATTTAQLVDVAPPMGELYANPQATQQMLDDVFFNAASWLSEELGVAFAEAESSAFATGNGVNQPSGILSATMSALSDATRPWGQLQYIPTTNAGGFAPVTATASPFDILQQAIFSMRPGYRRDAVFMMHPTTLSALAQTKDTIGRPIMVPSQVLGQPPTIMGYPALEAEHFPSIAANAYVIMFANLTRGFLIVDRIGIRVLQDPFSNKPFVGFYTTKRTGGAVINSECIKLVKCSVT